MSSRNGSRPPLIALSGLDGAGKSTLAARLRDHMEAGFGPTRASWIRLGAELDLLEAVAEPVKRLLRRDGTVGDPVAAGGPDVAKRQHAGEAARRTMLAWVWIVLVALFNVRSCRRIAAARRRGEAVICDRWMVDALVDLRLRYGRHRVAETLIRIGVPRPDLAFLLVIDPEAAEARKPRDQARRVLTSAQRLYDEQAARHCLVRVDATRPPDLVYVDAAEAVDRLLRTI